MNFTPYGKTLAASEPVPDAHPLGGATAHMHACSYDAGNRVLLTGKAYDGARIRREAQSLYGAFMTAQAVGGIQRGWHILPDGTRKLVFVR